jgi:hypothetical protein
MGDELLIDKEAPAAAPDQAAGSEVRSRFARIPAVAILISILVAAVLAESVLLFRGNTDVRARNEVVQTSTRFLALLTTYNSATLDAQRREVLALATGKFRGEYQQLTGSSFLSALKDRQANSTGHVVRASVESVGSDTATTLCLVQVTVTNRDIKTPRAEQDLIELSLVKTSAGWRIDAVTILGQLSA